jgi:RNA polymerase-binding transcription factor DksA
MNIQKSADEVDMASELEMIFNEKAIEAVTARLKPETDPDFDGKTCVECGDDMPPIRLAYNRIRCCNCQTIKERMVGYGSR